jgi:predicted nucleotide-binding protein
VIGADRVLVVDDGDEPEIVYVEQLITACGFIVERATTWFDALERLRKLRGSFRGMFLDLTLGTGPQDGFILMDRMEKENLGVPTQVISHSADLIPIIAACERYSFVRTRPLKKNNLLLYKPELESFILTPPPVSETTAIFASKPKSQSRGVFVTYGRDQTQYDRVTSILRKLGLDPVGIDREARQGRTIIEAVEHYAASCSYAVVIMTGDDCGFMRDSESELRPRPRQNVIFELGFLFGLLGRDRVLCLVEREIERPSDIDGILYFSLGEDDSAIERCIVRELLALGIATHV